MRASARVVAERVGGLGGRTRCTTLQSQPPLTFRTNPTGLMWVATAAGPVGGDDLRLDVRLGPGAELAVASAGASIALPGARGERSQLRVDLALGARSCLIWHPEPTVLAGRADHVAVTLVELGAGADLTWVEELVLGRHGEAPGRMTSRLNVIAEGRVVLRTGLEIGRPGWDGPAVTGGRRAHAQVVLAGEPATHWRGTDAPELLGVEWTTAEMACGVELVTIVGREPRALRAAVGTVVSLTSPRPVPAQPM